MISELITPYRAFTRPAPADPPAPAPPPIYVASPVFTGSGAEYFRIWIVGVLLTLVTGGIYSAWFKVRKARYFRQNTHLDGHVFDFHGRPAAILRGRLIALVLFGAYSWTFSFSRQLGIMTVAVLCAIGPWLFMRAQQFSLANTSFRGLRFGFRARTEEAYLALLPIALLWVAPALYHALSRRRDFIPSIVFVLAIPWMHHRLKRYQRANATYGDRRFTMSSAALRFYWVYVKGIGLFLLAAVAVGAISVSLTLAMRPHGGVLVWIYGFAVMLVFYVTVWPYYAARLQQVVWGRTRLGHIRFHTEIRAMALFGLVLKNVGLTILTLGLYWPWASVALSRYRIECVRVESDQPLSMLAAGVEAPSVSAIGVGASEAFGLDIGL